MVQAIFEEFTKLKARVKILILGAYRPRSPQQPVPCRDRLEQTRTYLQSMRYLNAKLVADFPDLPRYHERDEVHFELKSKNKILHWATGLVFVLMQGCDNEGVGHELAFVDAQCPSLFRSSVVLLEKGVDTSTLTRGVIIRQSMEVNEFDSDAARNEFALGACLKILHKNYWQV